MDVTSASCEGDEVTVLLSGGRGKGRVMVVMAWSSLQGGVAPSTLTRLHFNISDNTQRNNNKRKDNNCCVMMIT